MLPFYPNSISSYIFCFILKSWITMTWPLRSSRDLWPSRDLVWPSRDSLYLTPLSTVFPKIHPVHRKINPNVAIKIFFFENQNFLYFRWNDNLNGFDQAPIASCGGAYSQSWNHSTILLVRNYQMPLRNISLSNVIAYSYLNIVGVRNGSWWHFSGWILHGW